MKPEDISVGTLCWCRVQDSAEHRKFDVKTGVYKKRSRTPVVVQIIVPDSDAGTIEYQVAPVRNGVVGRALGRLRRPTELFAEDKVSS